MSTYVREKVLRVPMDCEYDEMEEIEDKNNALFDYGTVGKFQIAPTEGSYIDYVLEYEWDADGEYGKTRALYLTEQEKYRPIWQQILPDIYMSKVRLVEFCWYNCCEAPDYYDDEKDDFYNDLVYRTQDYNAPAPKDTTEQEGWICPVCGRGVAPWVDYCPCQSDRKITYGTSTGINGFADIDECMKWVKEYQDKITKELK